MEIDYGDQNGKGLASFLSKQPGLIEEARRKRTGVALPGLAKQREQAGSHPPEAKDLPSEGGDENQSGGSKDASPQLQEESSDFARMDEMSLADGGKADGAAGETIVDGENEGEHSASPA